ncbi:MAG TPA: hypothetical protein VIB39_18140 [Candidatus Angelobacter sp.]|jgi:uncharacterized membrane protein YbhN (UPF0104 family)
MDGRWVANFGKIAGLAGIAIGAFLVVTGRSDFLESKGGLSETHAFYLRLALLIFAFGVTTIGIVAYFSEKNKAFLPKALLLLLLFAVIVIFGAAIIVVSQASSGRDAGTHPAIKITKLPSFITSDPEETQIIEGTVTGVPPSSNYRVVIFVIRNNQSYVQPREDQPFTPILNNTWVSQTHRGELYYAFLVTRDFNPTQGVLPADDKDVIARDATH